MSDIKAELRGTNPRSSSRQCLLRIEGQRSHWGESLDQLCFEANKLCIKRRKFMYVSGHGSLFYRERPKASRPIMSFLGYAPSLTSGSSAARPPQNKYTMILSFDFSLCYSRFTRSSDSAQLIIDWFLSNSRTY